MFNFAQPFYPLLFAAAKSNPEGAHLLTLKALKWLDQSRHTPLNKWTIKQLQNSFCFADSRLSQTLWGLTFNNPFGLAPGFDKDGIAAGIWGDLGFGFVELGGVTLGGNNLGAEVMAKTLQESWQKHPRKIPVGINLIKSKITPLEEAAQDYLGSYCYLKDWADYFVVNVSSPNTPGLRSLQEGEQLEIILSALQSENKQSKPLFIKISPDLDWEAIKIIINLAKTYNLSGIIATNTTIQREGLKTKILAETGRNITEEAGGISGLPLQSRSTEIIRFIWQETQGTLPIIGVGGIFTPEDAWEKIAAGASLIQVYTGWIYQGPWMIRQILQGLLDKLSQYGLSNISEAVGQENQF
jgi:dihydroorotate dehydrogenase